MIFVYMFNKRNFALRILVFALISASAYYFLFINTCPFSFNKNEILGNLISITSIIIAIIVTYIFSKLFAEKSTRIERKREIDELAKKLTYLRRIAFHIRGMYKFWDFEKGNLKKVIDKDYSDLTYEKYRYFKDYKISYEDNFKVSEAIYGSDGQGYLALKGLEAGENPLRFFTEFNPKNYSLNDIIRFREYASSFWYLLDNSDKDHVNFIGASNHEMDFVNELYLKITGVGIDKSDYKNSIKSLFSHFESELFDKLLFLTKQNSNLFPNAFRRSFFNMLTFLITLIITIFILVTNNPRFHEFGWSIGVISLFVANTVDLIIITAISIREELNVNEIFVI